MEENRESRKTRQNRGLLGFSRTDASVLPFIFAGLGAAFVSAMDCMALSYDSRPMTIRSLISYGALLLFFPAFLVALSHRRWLSLPLWAVSLALLALSLMHPRDLVAPSSIKGAGELFGVVLLTETARFIRGKKRTEPSVYG